MLVTKKTLLAAQAEVSRLRRELDQALSSQERYVTQERELVDALVASRAEARQLRQRAEEEAQEVRQRASDDARALRDQAQAELQRAESRALEVLEDSRRRSEAEERATRDRLASLQAEVARLKRIQEGFTTSLQRGLAALGSLPRDTSVSAPSSPAHDDDSDLIDDPIQPVWPAPPALSSWLAGLREPEPSPAPPVPETPLTDHATNLDAPPASSVGEVPAPRAFGRTREPAPKARWAPWTGRLGVGLLLVITAALAVALVTPRLRHPATGPDADTAAAGLPAEATPNEPPVAATTGSASNVQSPAPVPLLLNLRSQRGVWLRAEVDGQGVLARLVRQGEEIELKAQRDVVLRVGDAGALLARVNGSEWSALGPSGAVVTRRFDAAGRKDAERAGGPTAAAAEPPASGPAAGVEPHAQPSTVQARTDVEQAASPAASLPRSEASSRQPPPSGRLTPREPPAATTATPASPGVPDASANAPSDEALVREAHQAYFDALGRGDTGRMSMMTAEGFTATGAPAVDETGIPHAITIRSAVVEIRGVGAVVSGTASQHVPAPNGSTREQSLLFSEVWIKSDGAWRLMNVRFLTPGGAR